MKAGMTPLRYDSFPEDDKDYKNCFYRRPASLQIEESGCVSQWLDDLCTMTEMECMCVLQGKSLSNQTTDVVFHANKSVKDYIDSIRARSHIISSEFTKLFKKIDREKWKHVKTASLRLTCHVRSLLHECNSCILHDPPWFSQNQQQIMEECARLAQYVELNIEVNGHIPDKAILGTLLTALGETFGSLVDLALGVLIQKLIVSLNTLQSVFAVRATIDDIVSLGLEGEHMCYLIAREGGIESLFSICHSSSMSSVRHQALRAIATICCVPESISQLEQVGGLGSLSDMLNDSSLPEIVKSEAAGVIAQITSPCIEQSQHLGDFIENMDDLVKSLTDLCEHASSGDVFLLGAAALANMTFMDSMACDFLLRYNSTRVLVTACQTHNKAASIFAKDQVATVLANTAAVDSCLDEIVVSGGLKLLVEMLHIPQLQHNKDHNQDHHLQSSTQKTELAACERMHQKVAIALTRLSRDPESAKTLVQLNVIPRLVELCRDPKQRNHSDAVLVACLAAVRKICGNCQLDIKENSDLHQLTGPRLMDSFLICSGMEESFV